LLAPALRCLNLFRRPSRPVPVPVPIPLPLPLGKLVPSEPRPKPPPPEPGTRVSEEAVRLRTDAEEDGAGEELRESERGRRVDAASLRGLAASRRSLGWEDDSEEEGMVRTAVEEGTAMLEMRERE
jgi:hypothetical protein